MQFTNVLHRRASAILPQAGPVCQTDWYNSNAVESQLLSERTSMSQMVYWQLWKSNFLLGTLARLPRAKE